MPHRLWPCEHVGEEFGLLILELVNAWHAIAQQRRQGSVAVVLHVQIYQQSAVSASPAWEARRSYGNHHRHRALRASRASQRRPAGSDRSRGGASLAGTQARQQQVARTFPALLERDDQRRLLALPPASAGVSHLPTPKAAAGRGGGGGGRVP